MTESELRSSEGNFEVQDSHIKASEDLKDEKEEEYIPYDAIELN